MRIAVIGTGAIGGTIAALLDRGGHDVTVAARGEQLAAIGQHGIRLDGAWGQHVARVTAAERLVEPPELAFVCTKAQDAARAIEENRAALDGIRVVVVQNGLSGLDEAAALLPESRCLGALALYAASLVEPGEITVTTAANTYVGSGGGEPDEDSRAVAAVLNAVMPTAAVRNFRGCQWTKLVVNQINAMPAITGLSVQETLADPALRAIVTASMREAVRTGVARGVRFGSIQGLSNGILRLFNRAPSSIAQLVPLLIKRRLGATPNPGSTLQSLRRGQRTEIDYLNGAVVAEAARAGRVAPVNAALVRLVHEVETAEEFLPPTAVSERLRPLLRRGPA
jgi:2-dehydropantoate 2-reductase